jgi:amino acid transporter
MSSASSEDQRSTALEVDRISQIGAVGQSLAGIAPTATPAMVVPLLLLTSGKSACITFLIATLGMLCVARQINLFAKRTASPGSLYSYVRGTLGPRSAVVTGWALLVAYLATCSAAAAGFSMYVSPLLDASASLHKGLPLCTMAVAVSIASYLAYRDVRFSARVMLVIEACSIVLVALLFCLPGSRSIWHVDLQQLMITRGTTLQIGRGLTLAIFSLVGFESATALGTEVRCPLKSVPRAVWMTALVSGLFFSLSAYAENIGFQGRIEDLAGNAAPLQILARIEGLPLLAPALALGAASSFFACILACCTAAARMMFQMSRDGYLSPVYGNAHARHKTPHLAVVMGGSVALIPLLILTFLNVGPLDIYGWLGTLATFGFLTGYLMLLCASVVLMSRESAFSIWSVLTVAGATGVISIAILGTVSQISQSNNSRLPLVYAALLLIGLGVSALWVGRRSL